VRRNEAEYGSILLVRYLYQAKVIEFVLFPVTITEWYGAFYHKLH